MRIKILLLSSVPPPPNNIQKSEKYACTKLFKMPYDSLSHVESLSSGQIGIKTTRSLDFTFTATKTRFLNAKSSLIQQLHRDLLNSIDDRPFASASRLSRAFWSDDLIISNILNGSSQCALDPSLSEDDALIGSAVSAAVAANAKVQRHVYKVLADNFFKMSAAANFASPLFQIFVV